MKLTKAYLESKGITNTWNIGSKLNQIFIDYHPAQNSRLNYHYAFWRIVRLKENGGFGYIDFTVTCRENKQPELEKAIYIAKQKYGVDITDKDPFGGWHIKGTLDKLANL
jgi:hypothetical protein